MAGTALASASVASDAHAAAVATGATPATTFRAPTYAPASASAPFFIAVLHIAAAAPPTAQTINALVCDSDPVTSVSGAPLATAADVGRYPLSSAALARVASTLAFAAGTSAAALALATLSDAA